MNEWRRKIELKNSNRLNTNADVRYRRKKNYRMKEERKRNSRRNNIKTQGEKRKMKENRSKRESVWIEKGKE